MRYLILFLIAVFLSSCSYTLTLMPRDGGTIYHGIATGDGISGRGTLSIRIDDVTYSGTWTATRESNSVTVINNPQPAYSSPLSSAMAGASAAASAAMASASASRRSSGRAILNSPEGRGLRCDFRYDNSGIGDGMCVDDKGRVYDMQISRQLIGQVKPLTSESQHAAIEEKPQEEREPIVTASPKLPNSEASEWSEKSTKSVQQGQWAEAIRCANVAISLDPNLPDPYINRAWAYAEKGLYGKALEDCESAICIDPRQAKAINNRGLTYLRMGQQDKAIQDYRKACEMGLDVSCNNFKELVGYLPFEEISALLKNSDESFSKGEYDRVIALSSRVIELQPNNAEAYSNRCGAKATQGYFAEAKGDCLKAISLNPDHAMAYNNLGFVLEREGNAAEAALQYEISCGLGNSLGCKNQKKLGSGGK